MPQAAETQQQQTLLATGERNMTDLSPSCGSKSCCSHTHAEDKADACSAIKQRGDNGEGKTQACSSSGGRSSCKSGSCRTNRLQRMKQLAELRELKKWHRGDFNSLYNRNLKHGNEDGLSTAIPVIVWGCLPCITIFAPFLGHAGLLRSDGALLDFALSYVVGLDAPAFGKPIRLISLESFITGEASSSIGYELVDKKTNVVDIESVDRESDKVYVYSWDKVVAEAVREYQNEQYGFFTNNCHTFVAHCLNKAKVPGPWGLPWNMVTVACVIFFRSRFVSFTSLATRLALTAMVAGAGFVIFGPTFFFWWGITLGLIVSYFLLFTYLYQWRP